MLTINPYVSGAPSVTHGSAFTLNLAATGTDTVSHWVIDWGDGTTKNTTGDLNPNPATLSKTYANAGAYAVTATVYATPPGGSLTSRDTGGLALDVGFDSDGKNTGDLTAAADFGYAVALQADGKIVMAGKVGNDFGLARFNADGSRDMGFDDDGLNGGSVELDIAGGVDVAYAVAVQPDGKIVVAGSAGVSGNATDFAVARFNSNGTVDTTFGGGDGKLTTNFGGAYSGDEAYDVLVQPDGYIVAVGTADVSAPGAPCTSADFAVSRYTPAGVPDTTFGAPSGGARTGKTTVNAGWNVEAANGVVLQPDGKLVLAGEGNASTGTPGSDMDFLLARFNRNGTLDTSFDTDGLVRTDFSSCASSSVNDSAYDVVLQRDGKVVAVGASAGHFALARYNHNGSLDTTFGEVSGAARTGKTTTVFSGVDTARGVALQPDDKLVVAGQRSSVSWMGTGNDYAVARYNADGTLDASFGKDGKVTTDFGNTDDAGRGVAVQPDGKVVVAGYSTNKFSIARYQPDNKVRVVPATAVFSVSDVTITEGDSGTSNAVFTVTRSGDTTSAVSVAYGTFDETAIAPDDYTAVGGTLNFAASETSKTVTVQVKGDTLAEAHGEFFRLGLKNPSGGAAIAAKRYALGTITDNEAMPTLPAQSGNSLMLMAQAEANQITLKWVPRTANGGYHIDRRPTYDSTWSRIASGLSASTSTYTDATAMPGVAYEYQLSQADASDPDYIISYAYVLSGDMPLTQMKERRGTVVIVVDKDLAGPLAPELNRLWSDLIGDGWYVIRHDVAPDDDVQNPTTGVWASRREGVQGVRNLILANYNTLKNDNDATNDVTTVLLLGHVPVPYSGDISPDAHSDHQGAWPADVYYGDMNSTWPDSSVNETSSANPHNHNVPGDGKFDPNDLYNDHAPELAVGRVDLKWMGGTRDYTTLMRDYLNKDHNFRVRDSSMDPDRRALVDDYSNIGYNAPGYRAFGPLVGPSNVETRDWFDAFTGSPQPSYLWGHAAGGGGYDYARFKGSGNGQAFSSDFVSGTSNVVFTNVFGSYHGDWNTYNNFLRAPLASTMGLTAAWSGRPDWFYHHMGLGETIGVSTRVSQSNDSFDFVNGGGLRTSWDFDYRSIHMALMGDPTLRMHVVSPPSSLSVSTITGGLGLSWTASPDDVEGYAVYRAESPEGPYTRLNPGSLVRGTTYDDVGGLGAHHTYMVRAVKREETPSGRYYNPSQGIFCDTAASASFVGVDNATVGNWSGTYGSTARTIVGDTGSNPSYAAVTARGNNFWQWSDGDTDTRHLKRVGSSTDRVAAAWYNAAGFELSARVSDYNTHRVSIYMLDWDNTGRSQRVEILDAFGNVLNSQDFSSFGGGRYATWDIRGDFTIRVKNLGSTSSNAVISGLFFQPTP